MTTGSGTSSPCTRAMIISAARRPLCTAGLATVVSGGTAWAAIGMSSNPTTATSSGMRRPASRSAVMTPNATVSLPQKTASSAAPSSSRRRIAA